MLYRFLKMILNIGMYFYYKRVQIIDRQKLPKSGARLLIANHPNTMMDAWILGNLYNEPIYFMTKGTFFKGKFKSMLLKRIGLIPINRSTEAKTEGVSNQDSFDQCYKILAEGKVLAIFPEGNSFAEKLLRKLKSGTARIVLETELQNEGELGIQVIPVGLVYLQPEKFRSSVLVKVGDPISALPFLETFRIDRLKAARQLTEVFRKGLSDLLVASEVKENETLADGIAAILNNPYLRSEKTQLERDVLFLRQVNERINEINKYDPERIREIDQLVYKINWQVERLRIKSSFLDRRFRFGMFMRQLLQSIVVLILGSPLFLFGLMHNVIPYYLSAFLLKKIVWDVEFYAPVAVLVGLVLYPLNYWGFLTIFNYFTDLNEIYSYFYFFSLPLIGLFAFSFFHYMRHVSFKWKFILLMKNEDSFINQLRSDREFLREIVFSDHFE